jgi:hypothetical protein
MFDLYFSLSVGGEKFATDDIEEDFDEDSDGYRKSGC